MSDSHQPGRVFQRGLGQRFKLGLQRFTRTIHHSFFDRGLPDRLAIYLHELDPLATRLLDDSITELKRLGYRFVDAATYDSTDDHAGKVVMVSFDDNYRSWFENLDLFDRHEIKAMFYVNTLPLGCSSSSGEVVDYYNRLGAVADRRPLTESELTELVARGHGIGAHTHSHYNLGALSDSEALADIAVNLEVLAKIANRDIVDFSFPFGMPGNFRPVLEDKVRAMGVVRIAHATPGMQHVAKHGGTIHRALWRQSRDFSANLQDARVDGSKFVQMTGKSPVG
ncbi:MAG: polysaccharide deacetylase family protein [Luteolibacter sp.]